MKLFTKRQKPQTQEMAPQLTLAERRSLEWPGPVGPIPPHVYDEMSQDSMIQTALTIKKLSVLAADFNIVPADETKEAQRKADFVHQVFEQMEGNPRSVLQGAMDAFAKGWSIQEKVYEERNGQIWLRAIRAKDPAYFGLVANEFGSITGVTLRVPGEDAKDLDRDKFVLFMNRGNYQSLRGKSDLDAAYRHWQAKKALLNAWKLHLERFASPTILGKYQRGMPTDEQNSILRALQNLHDNTAIVFPSEINIDLLHARSHEQTSFLDALEFHNREIARSILGQTLTTDEGRRVGSLSLGKVHLQVLMLQVAAIRRELSDLVMNEQIIRPLIEMNFGPGQVPRFEFVPVQLEAFTIGKV